MPVGVRDRGPVRRSRAVRAVAGFLAVVAVLWAAPTARAGVTQSLGERAAAQRILAALRIEGGAPGNGVTWGDGDTEFTLASGTRNILTGKPIGPTDAVRVGSNTKMFVASVALQLVEEGRLALDVPIDRYLPGVLRYPAGTVSGDPAAFDGRTVTLRQLLQHTGGVPDYADIVYALLPTHLVVVPTPADHLAHALPNGPAFRPGHGWAYSNTGYALIGLIIERVTGRSLTVEIAERITEPLGLTGTFFPRPGQRLLPGAHVRGYFSSLAPVDLTNLEPAVYGAAGALVSSARDMNTFLSALLAGRVVPAGQLAAMQDDVPYLSGGYGLGLVRVPLSCGQAWGHSGFVPGYQTLNLALADGRHLFFTQNTSFGINLTNPEAPASAMDLAELLLC